MDSLLTSAKLEKIEQLAREVSTLFVPGSAADVGCYQGGLLPMLSSILPDRMVHAFDTFEGVPARDWLPTDQVKPGAMADAFYDAVTRRVAVFENVRVRAGYFPASAQGIDHEQFCFVHVDLSTQLGTEHAIAFFWRRMPPGAVLVINDCDLPGIMASIKWAGLDVTCEGGQAIARKPSSAWPAS